MINSNHKPGAPPRFVVRMIVEANTGRAVDVERTIKNRLLESEFITNIVDIEIDKELE